MSVCMKSGKVLATALLLMTSVTLAAPPQPSASPAQRPPVAAKPASPSPAVIQQAREGQFPEPAVTIIQNGNETIYEYRRGGQLYLVRVVPRFGPPYYFYDVNGDGELDLQQYDPRRNSVNQWVLFRW